MLSWHEQGQLYLYISTLHKTNYLFYKFWLCSEWGETIYSQTTVHDCLGSWTIRFTNKFSEHKVSRMKYCVSSYEHASHQHRGKKKTEKRKRIPFQTSTAHKERDQLGDQRNDGERSCNSGDGTGQMAQPWMFMMMNNNISFPHHLPLNAVNSPPYRYGKTKLSFRLYLICLVLCLSFLW